MPEAEVKKREEVRDVKPGVESEQRVHQKKKKTGRTGDQLNTIHICE
jgi:hypothetical protein